MHTLWLLDSNYGLIFQESLSDVSLELAKDLAQLVAVHAIGQLVEVVLNSDAIFVVELRFALRVDRVHCANHFHQLAV